MNYSTYAKIDRVTHASLRESQSDAIVSCKMDQRVFRYEENDKVKEREQS